MTHAIVNLIVNGDRRQAGVPVHYTLLETLRYGMGLTGSKQGCDKGDCGACTVLLDGAPVLSCITPVWEAEGREVTTVEGLASPGRPHPLQEAFGEFGAAQCGFCTPGILMSAEALLERTTSPTRYEIQEALSGNLCRCTGYTKIYDAVEKAAAVMRGEPAAVTPVTAGVSAGSESPPNRLETEAAPPNVKGLPPEENPNVDRNASVYEKDPGRAGWEREGE